MLLLYLNDLELLSQQRQSDHLICVRWLEYHTSTIRATGGLVQGRAISEVMWIFQGIDALRSFKTLERKSPSWRCIDPIRNTADRRASVNQKEATGSAKTSSVVG